MRSVDPALNGFVQKQRPGPPLVAWVGDDLFMDLKDETPLVQTVSRVAARELGVLPFEVAEWGIGWLADGWYGSDTVRFFDEPFGHDELVRTVAAAKPDAIVICGGNRDLDKEFSSSEERITQIQGAAEVAIARYRAACPRVPITVVGPWPTRAERTVDRMMLDGVLAVQRAAAKFQDQGVAFRDWIFSGFAEDVNPSRMVTWDSMPAQGIPSGTVFSYQGAWYRATGDIDAGTKDTGPYPDDAECPTSQLTAALTGRGRWGMANRRYEGTRDVFMHSGNYMPTAWGNESLGLVLSELFLSAIGELYARGPWWKE